MSRVYNPLRPRTIAEMLHQDVPVALCQIAKWGMDETSHEIANEFANGRVVMDDLRRRDRSAYVTAMAAALDRRRPDAIRHEETN